MSISPSIKRIGRFWAHYHRSRHILVSMILIGLGSGLALPPTLAASAGTYRQQGLAYRQQGQFPEAIAALKQAVDLEPLNVSGRVLLGWTLHLAGQDDDAAQALLMALYLDPKAVPTLNALGIVYLVQGELLAAALTHAWAAGLSPTNEIACYNLSLTYERMQRYDWSVAYATRAAELEPSNPHPLVALAIAHWRQGEPDRAKQAYQQAIRLDARYTNPDFLTHLKEAAFSPEQIQTVEQVLLSDR